MRSAGRSEEVRRAVPAVVSAMVADSSVGETSPIEEPGSGFGAEPGLTRDVFIARRQAGRFGFPLAAADRRRASRRGLAGTRAN